MGKNIISEEEAREKLEAVLESSDLAHNGLQTIDQMISAAHYSVSPEDFERWCTVCDRLLDACICDDEEAKKRERERQMTNLSEEEKQRLQDALAEQLRDQLSEEELEEIKRKRDAQEDMELCPVCYAKRVEDLIYSTGDRIIGCKLCLDRPEEVVQGDA